MSTDYGLLMAKIKSLRIRPLHHATVVFSHILYNSHPRYHKQADHCRCLLTEQLQFAEKIKAYLVDPQEIDAGEVQEVTQQYLEMEEWCGF